MTEYVTKQQFRNDKSRLTRAVRSGDPVKVLDAVEKTLDGWEGLAWPDDWSRWSVALYDAWLKYERSGWEERTFGPDTGTIDRFQRCYDRFR